LIFNLGRPRRRHGGLLEQGIGWRHGFKDEETVSADLLELQPGQYVVGILT